MGSVLSSIKCPNCSCSAVSDFYYKSDEEYIHCSHCGYNYSREYKLNRDGTCEIYIDEQKGYGVFLLFRKDDTSELLMFNTEIKDEDIQDCREKLMQEHVNQEKSYLVRFADGVFTVLLGNPPERFFMTFEELEKLYSMMTNH